MRVLAGIACGTALFLSPDALAQSYMLDCQPDAWMRNGVATPMSVEEKAGWPYRLFVFLDGKTGSGCDISLTRAGCADTAMWTGGTDAKLQQVTLARFRPGVTEPDGLMIKQGKNTFFGSFDGKAIAGACEVTDLKSSQ